MRYETPLDGSLLLLQKVAHKKSSLASSLLDAESFEQAVHVLDLGNSNSLIYVLGPLTVGVLASAVLMEVFSWSKRFEVGLLGLRSLWLLLAVLATVDMSILIPISYDIAQQLGHGALASGILVAASQAFQPVLALVSRWLVIGKSYQYQRRFMLCCFGAEAVLTWLMVPVFEACNHWSNQTVLYALVFLRAMTGGVLMLYGVPLSTCVYDSSPLEDRSQLSIKFYLCLSIGVCAGIMPWDSDFDVKLYTEQDITMEGFMNRTMEPAFQSMQIEAYAYDGCGQDSYVLLRQANITHHIGDAYVRGSQRRHPWRARLFGTEISLSPEHLEHIFFTRYRTPVAKLFGDGIALQCFLQGHNACMPDCRDPNLPCDFEDNFVHV